MTTNEAEQPLEPTQSQETGPVAAVVAKPAPSPAVVWSGRLGLLIALIGVLTRVLVAPLGLGLSLAAANRRMTAAGVLGTLIGLGGTLVAVDMRAKQMPVDVRPQIYGQALTVEKQLAMVQGWLKQYEAQYGEYPTTEQGWSVIPQAQPVPQDLWGNPLAYERPDPDWCEIRSAGPDGILKTDDDRAMPVFKPRSTDPATLAYWKDRSAVLTQSAVLFLVGLIGATVVIDRSKPAGHTPEPAADPDERAVPTDEGPAAPTE